MHWNRIQHESDNTSNHVGFKLFIIEVWMGDSCRWVYHNRKVFELRAQFSNKNSGQEYPIFKV